MLAADVCKAGAGNFRVSFGMTEFADMLLKVADGFTACRKIREFTETPVIMLSARGTEFDKLHGFEVGVDDYVTKPFSPMELMARIKVALRRGTPKPEAQTETVLTAGGIVINTPGMTVTADGEKLELTAKEYAILKYLVEHQGIVLSREQILHAVWGYDDSVVDRTVDWQIKLLRGKLGAYRDCIRTIRGVGYKFEA
jgi:DNA-binding response OmpR family regulator